MCLIELTRLVKSWLFQLESNCELKSEVILRVCLLMCRLAMWKVIDLRCLLLNIGMEAHYYRLSINYNYYQNNPHQLLHHSINGSLQKHSAIKDIIIIKLQTTMNLEIIQPKWTANDEIVLLELIQRLGFGNWREIRRQMRLKGIKKTLDDIQRHYSTCYLENSSFLPVFLHQKSKMDESIIIPNEKQILPAQELTFAEIHQSPSSANLPKMDSFFTKYFDFSYFDAHDYLFQYEYNRKRHELQEEYDEQAEKIISELQFKDNDTPQDQILKMNLIQEYNRRLNKRNTIRDMVIEHRFLEKDFQFLSTTLRSREESKVYKQFKALARFMNIDEHCQLVSKITLLRKVRKSLVGLAKIIRTQGRACDLSSIKREQVRRLFRAQKKKKLKQYYKPNEKKFDLLARQELELNIKESQELIKMIKLGDFRKIERIFSQISILIPSSISI